MPRLSSLNYILVGCPWENGPGGTLFLGQTEIRKFWGVQSTPDNSKLQGKLKNGRFIEGKII